MERRELASKVYDVCHLTGEFQLRSGKISNEYFDKYLFESKPELLIEIAKHLIPLIPEGVEVLAGLEMGGIPVATALSIYTRLPVVFVRKEAKTYGTCKLAEGVAVSDKKVCVVEDVVTTGGQIIQSAAQLRLLGAEIHDVVCVIERDRAGRDNLVKEGLQLRSVFTMSDLTPIR